MNRPTRPTGGGGTQPRQARAAGNVQIKEFVRQLIAEMKRVTWPSRDEWVSATVLVVALVILVGFFTWLVDLGFEKLFSLVGH
ncbi:MAG TPA: preprotein translocase subunit SecE [Candidatus Dormibacteraeota bacterium]|nr:preprotein translocase subunit SecE [Candidatus Dormibacteraeota bacterium]